MILARNPGVNGVSRSDLSLGRNPLSHCQRLPRGGALKAQAMLDVGRTSNNGSSLSPEELKEEVNRELHYRVATSSMDSDAAYASVAWSVHNRLLDTLNATNEFWKYVDVRHWG